MKFIKVLKANDLNTELLDLTYEGDIEGIKEVLKQGADINCSDEDGNTPLLFAVASKDLELVKLLVENKADLDLSNNLGETPLIVAQDNKYKEIEEYLLSMGTGYNGNNFRTL